MHEPATPRDEDYQRKFLDAASKKLAIPRDKDGAPDWEGFEIAKGLETVFSGYDGFVAVTRRGSGMHGYRQDTFPYSDRDYGIIFDPTTNPKQNLGFAIRTRGRFLLSELSRLLTKNIINIPQTFAGYLPFKNADPEVLKQLLTNKITSARCNNVLVTGVDLYIGLAFLAEHGRGAHLDEYRNYAQKIFASMDISERDSIRRTLVAILASWADMRTEKIHARMPLAFEEVGYSTGATTYVDSQAELWEKRLKKIYGL